LLPSFSANWPKSITNTQGKDELTLWRSPTIRFRT